MQSAVAEYEKLVRKFAKDKDVEAGQLFGKACLKVKGKAFVAQHKETVVFKLCGDSHARAKTSKGAKLWDPSGKGRPMKEWVALTASASRSFIALAQAAYEYVAGSR